MGLYPDGPSRRMAWDVDGTVGMYRLTTSGAQIALSAGEKATLNNETDGDFIPGMVNAQYFVSAVFPELREIDGAFVVKTGAGGTLYEFSTSANSTNGIDGTWVTAIADLPETINTPSNYRTDIISLAVPTEKAVRLQMHTGGNSISLSSLHLYGTFSPGETPDRILFLDTLNADAVFTKPINWNEIPRGQTQTRSFKIKNNSSGLTINTIQVTAEDLYLNAGNWYTFGDDNVNFQATFAVGNLGPGATKLLYLKQIIPDAETLGLQAGRIKVVHANLT